ncbi:MAG TPA: hypothetical protein VFB73_13490 [Chloroflexota bacterium]|nr:hypothetical protein [Chloroflexota bacterium]
MSSTAVAELEELVARFRAGEAEIATRMFERPRPRAQHRQWLRFQVAREARNLEELTSHLLCRLAEAVEESLSREDLVHRLTEDYQEVGHYAMLAYLYEGLTGEHLRWKPLRAEAKTAPWYEWSRREHARWAELKQHGTELEYAAALFTRGGGGALFYGFLQLQGGDYETLLAEAARIILHDELEHGASEGRDLLYPLLRTREDVETAKRIVTEMSLLRLRMRNEQFGHVLPEERLQAIAAGAIEPLTVETMWRACEQRVADWYALYHAKPKPLSATSVLD